VELAADWKFYPGWRFTAAYTYLDEIYTEYTENIINGGVFSFNRAGNKIPGISPNRRRPGSVMTNFRAACGARCIRRSPVEGLVLHGQCQPAEGAGYELVNLNVHYKTDLMSDYLRSLSLYLEVRNVFDRTYVALRE
jgi:iron complex outermembrane receptor protein